VRIGLLGPLEVRTDSGEPVPLAGGRLRSLLSRLALDPGRVVSTRQLIDAVWGSDPPDGAANALQALVSRLRRALPDLTVHSEPAGYRLDVDPQWTDVGRFERLVGSGRAAAATEPVRAACELRDALALWRGPALADAGFAESASARLTELRLAALEQLADLEPVPLIADLTAAVRDHPTREPLAVALMRALWTDGRPAEALGVFEQTRAALAETLGVDPTPRLRELHLSILRGDPLPVVIDPIRVGGGSAEAGAGRRSNLRNAITSFVGRDEEITRVRGLVAESRLLTLLGPGGSGKTRLAIESARGLERAFPDGIWFVELAPVSDPAEVPATVLATLGLREQALLRGSRSRVTPLEPTDTTARISNALADKRALLALDNCEHLIGAAAELADTILAECPAIRIMTTSREPLAIIGETLWTVEPLAVPAVGVDPEAARRFPSVRLLTDRGAAVRPGFAVDQSNVDAVVELCRALDGMPLAIELAAARLRTMTVAQIVERLDDRFRLLVAGSRTALPRHQTLRAVVDWSWDLLDQDERTLLRRLAVFTGGATAAAVESVCRTGPATFALLTALVDKSLVVIGPGDRYGMLDTIRAYGLDRLADAGEADAVRADHGAYFVALAELAEPQLRRADQLDWLARLAADHENLHSATRRAIAAGDSALALRLTASLGWYWFLHGHRGEGGELAIQALALDGPAPPAARALSCAIGAVNSLTVQQNMQTSRDLLEQAVQLSNTPDTDHPLLRLIAPLSRFLPVSGGFSGTQTDVMSSFSDCFDDPDPWVRAAAHAFHAHAAFNSGLDDEAEREFHEGLAGFQATGDRWGIAFSLATLAEAAAGHGEHRAAADYLADALATISDLATPEDLCQAQAQYAHELLMIGESEQARANLAAAQETADRAGLLECRVQVAYEQGEFARFAGDLQGARDAYERAIAVTRTWPVAPQFRAILCSALAGVVDLDRARELTEQALEAALGSQDRPAIRRVLVGVAEYLRRSGDPLRAAALLGASADNKGRPAQGLAAAGQIVQAVRAELSQAAYAEAFARGRSTAVTEVAQLAGFAAVTVPRP
jgi:predicted ATPase/DNA-binding SARP family transcriptional activator